MIESPDGRVGGSIDRARVEELLAGTRDKELQAHYREVLGEPAEATNSADSKDEAAERSSSSSESETSSSSGSEDGDEDLDALRAEAESHGVKVDGRWGAQRLQDEIDAAGKKGKR